MITKWGLDWLLASVSLYTTTAAVLPAWEKMPILKVTCTALYKLWFRSDSGVLRVLTILAVESREGDTWIQSEGKSVLVAAVGLRKLWEKNVREICEQHLVSLDFNLEATE